ncbi:hypothetical protein BC629DRAFT_1592741 [Irpex lacteus]|nr:hypothetical protein BC629DRAFT_1592741 [Irpex lacteus]
MKSEIQPRSDVSSGAVQRSLALPARYGTRQDSDDCHRPLTALVTTCLPIPRLPRRISHPSVPHILFPPRLSPRALDPPGLVTDISMTPSTLLRDTIGSDPTTTCVVVSRPSRLLTRPPHPSNRSGPSPLPITRPPTARPYPPPPIGSPADPPLA